MKNVVALLFFVLSIALFITSCTEKKDPYCLVKHEGTIIEKIVLPDSLPVNSLLQATVKVSGRNGCSRFEGFYPYYQRSEIYYPYGIYINPYVVEEGCICTENLPVFEPTFTYSVNDTGRYYISYMYNDTLQQDTLYVY